MKALLSVYDKTGVVDFARNLQKIGMELVSTGGTHQALSDADLPVQQVSELTGSPEILDGRVKTLHPIIHGGILARRDKPEHVSELADRKMDTIDLVAVNLYPFADTIARPDVTLDDALEIQHFLNVPRDELAHLVDHEDQCPSVAPALHEGLAPLG